MKYRYISVLFFVFIILVIVLADTDKLPHFIRAIYDFPNGDKAGHFILYGLLNFFFTSAFLSALPSKPRIWVALSVGLVLSIFIGVEEWSQQYFSSRTSSFTDLFASYLGVLVGGWIALRRKN
jgi:VanZ family protein